MDDLISRQEALNALNWTWAGAIAIQAIKDLPSEELPIKEKCCVCPHCDNCDVNDDGTITAQSERKKGKWILQDDRNKRHYGWYICSECSAVIGELANFCSECGSDMRGEGDPE